MKIIRMRFINALVGLSAGLGAQCLSARARAAPPLVPPACYVDATVANAAGCGSIANPCGTLKYAVNHCAGLGSMIHLVGLGPHTVKGVTITFSVHVRGIAIGANVPTLDAAGADRHFVIQNGATLTVDGVRLTGGATPGSMGGSIRVDDGVLEVTNSIAELNSADDGGFVYCGSRCARVKITDSTLRDNVSSSHGAAVFSLAEVVIRRSAVEGNVAGGEGAIHMSGVPGFAPPLSVTETHFAENDAFEGGAIFANDSLVARCSFVRNSAVVGSALSSDPGGVAAVYNTTFAENTASVEATVFANGEMTNVTMVNNLAATGQAQDIYDGMVLKNSILTHPNRGTGERECEFPLAGERNLVDTDSCGSAAPFWYGAHNNAALNPLGFHNYLTMFYKLASFSNALNVANSCDLTVDQRNVARPGPPPAGGAPVCDLGAFERW